MVSKTREDFPEPDTPVNAVIFCLGMFSEMSLRLFSRAPRTAMNRRSVMRVSFSQIPMAIALDDRSLNPERALQTERGVQPRAAAAGRSVSPLGVSVPFLQRWATAVVC